MFKSFKFLALGLIFAFVVSCSAEDTAPDPPTAEEIFAAGFSHVAVTTTVTATDDKVYLMSTIDGMSIVTDDSGNPYTLDSVYEGNASTTTVARYKRGSEYIKYIFNNTNNKFIKVVKGFDATGEVGTEALNAKSFAVQVEGEDEKTPMTTTFMKSIAGRIVTSSDQLGGSTINADIHFADIDENGKITLKTTPEAIKVHTHIWGNLITTTATAKVQLTSTMINVDSSSMTLYGLGVYLIVDEVNGPAVFNVRWNDYFKPKSSVHIFPFGNLKNSIGATIE